LREALATLGNPQCSLRSILVVGTNGKGSVAAMVAAMLSRHGASAGLYTSPHLVRVEERIRINGQPIDGERLQRYLAELDRFADLTFFETLTAAAVLAFAESKIDVAVLEAGMGGSWDATRVANSAIVGLTNVGTDHTRWLGGSVSEIARDKGRALAAARRAVVGPQVDETTLSHLGAPNARRAVHVIATRTVDRDRVEIDLGSPTTEISRPLPGDHQVANLALAMALAKCALEEGWMVDLSGAAVRRALANLEWPGRLSRHTIEGREVLLDCAHNAEAAHALAGYLGRVEERYNMVFSCLEDKPVEAMAAALRPHVGTVTVCPLDDQRGMAIERLAGSFPGAVVARSPLDGVRRTPDPVLAAGSLRLVGDLLEHAEEGCGP
jgi:dihydrofolate synthase/folylpolyglutamate synthase